ncbi:MAG: VWA-like domain-containing protein, partial [Thiohalocapsa sp.]|nr:VWA-like domain-containing protein [Thiohalocapsa sp.]
MSDIETRLPSDDPAGHGRRPVYSHRGTRAIQRMVEYAPSTGSLALWIRHADVDDERGPGPLITANDGARIFYGPQFETLALALQTGLVAHQVLHVALRHPQRMVELRRVLGDVDAELYNICADAIINSTLSHLGWLALPDGSVMLEDLLRGTLDIRESVEKSLLEWDLERLYRAIDDRKSAAGSAASTRAGRARRDGEGAGGRGEGARREDDAGRTPEPREDGIRSARARSIGAGALRDLLPAADAERPEAEAEQAREWRERIVRAHAGDGAHSMLRELLADLPTVRTPWELLLRTQLARGLSMQPDLSWSRPSRSYIANRGRVGGGRRMPWEPGISSARSVARLAVMVDVSGSIDDRLLDRFAGEIEAITRRTEASAVIIIGDDRVSEVAVFEPGRSNLRDVRFRGGGGT